MTHGGERSEAGAPRAEPSVATAVDVADVGDIDDANDVIAVDARPTVIRLGQFLKYAGLASSGGEAKLRIGEGDVTVNGAVETRRRRQLKNGDVVSVDGTEAVVDLPEGGVDRDDA